MTKAEFFTTAKAELSTMKKCLTSSFENSLLEVILLLLFLNDPFGPLRDKRIKSLAPSVLGLRIPRKTPENLQNDSIKTLLLMEV